MTCRSAAAERLDWALTRLVECRSTTAVVTEVAQRWGVSRRSAQRVVARAHQQLVDDIEGAGVERVHAVAQIAHGLMEAMSQALATKNSGAVVGCAKELRVLLGLGATPEPSRRTTYGRSGF